MSKRAIHVIAGVLRNRRGEVLVGQRRASTHLAGYWEFPGGKLETGETREEGLRRELNEELGVEVLVARPLIQVAHDYAEKSVLLDVWQVEAFQGEPHGKEGQSLQWVSVDRLPELQLPAADVPVVAALRLPDRYVISPEPGGDLGQFLADFAQLIERGERLVQLRAKQLPAASLASLADHLAPLCERAGVSMLLNDALDLARSRHLGVHLSAQALLAQRERPLPADRWVGASCHNEAELAHAAAIGVDFAVLGPVRATASHPGSPVLGWGEFERLAQAACLPVYALGGVGPEDVTTAWSHGAQGVAGISAFWPRP